MSDGKIDEAITTTTNENGDKEDETLNNSVSDGEIFDDEPEEEKIPIIDLPRKNLKNFRARHDNSDSEVKVDSRRNNRNLQSSISQTKRRELQMENCEN
jgi:hypothetical protein